MKHLPKLLFFLLLLFYPLFSFFVHLGSGLHPNYAFGLICFVFLAYRLLIIYRDGSNLNVPYYLVLFAIFTTYAIFSNIIASDELEVEGVFKYFYSNPFFLTLIAFLIVENTVFPKRWIKWASNILVGILILAAAVSVIQVFDPLFFNYNADLVGGLSYDRLEEYYRNNPEESSGNVSRFFKNYRLSIYSYITQISVGMDAIAIFSLLIALKSKTWLRSAALIAAAALISFLSSSRWIMLNFLVVASQIVWTAKNKVSSLIKYGLFGIAIILLMIPLLKFSGIDIERFTQDRLLSNSANTRIYAFEVFGKVFPDQPILGTGGVDTPKMERLIQGRTSQIHVGYLKLFYYYGLLGGILYLSFLVSMLVRLWKIGQRTGYWGGFYAILAFAIANLTLVELDMFYHGIIL
ncbi:MAG: O-antigen ligase family protein, partial [Flavobacteriaceae bacterium]